MKAVLGVSDYMLRQKQQVVPVAWEPERALNPHVLLLGTSGSGKTFTIRRLVNGAVRSATRPLRVHIFDVHGDLSTGPDGGPLFDDSTAVRYSESTDYGLNPLIVDPDPHFGGVRRRIQSVIAAINRTSTQLGAKQEAVLRELLSDLYAANGFYADKPDSWRLDDGIQRRYPKKYPTLLDALRFAQSKLKAMYLGADSRAVALLEVVNKRAATLAQKLRNQRRRDAATGGAADEAAEMQDAELDKAMEQAIDAYSQYVRAIRTGSELGAAIKYDSKDVLKSVVDRLGNLVAVGVFRNQPPPFDPGKSVQINDIKALGRDEQQLFVYFKVEEILLEAIQRGPSEHVRELVVIDEAHLFVDDEPTNPINALAKEARKFGVGLVCASQSAGHFSEDILTNLATKVILGLDEMHWDAALRKLRLPPEVLKYIKPRKTIAVQRKLQGELRSEFQLVDGSPSAETAAA